MAKTLISRLDAENIVRAAVDPETHEATGDVYDSVNDVSYPFGGEGGESIVRYLAVHVENASGTFDDLIDYDQIEPTMVIDGTVNFNYYSLPVEDFYCLYTYAMPMVDNKVLRLKRDGYQNTHTFDNCTASTSSTYTDIAIENETKDASITIRLVPGE